MRILPWKQEFCGCTAYMNIDTEEIHVKPCNPDHDEYIVKIADGVLHKKLYQMQTERRFYGRKLIEYLSWLPAGIFMRPMNMRYAKNGLTAHQAMQDWEFQGVVDIDDTTVPTLECEQPDLLANYVQGKRCREFNITNWLEDLERSKTCDYKDPCMAFLTQPEEYIGEKFLKTPCVEAAINHDNFSSIFGFDPRPELLVLYGKS